MQSGCGGSLSNRSKCGERPQKGGAFEEKSPNCLSHVSDVRPQQPWPAEVREDSPHAIVQITAVLP